MRKTSLYIKYLDANGTEQSFPSAAVPAVVTKFTYTAQRMGSAPTITATCYYRSCLDNVWTKKEYVTLNGEKYYVSQVPTSSKSNDNLMYQHDITFTSERLVLENTYFLDVVTSDTLEAYKDRYRSNDTSFSTYCDIVEFAARLTDSMKYSGLNYSVVIDSGISSETKEVSFSEKYLSEALQEIYNTFKLAYYFVGHVIHVGYTENAITTPFEYGDNLLKITKTNANYKICDRVTGVGSTENIQYYYPNDNASGKAVFTCNKGNELVSSIDLSVLLALDGNLYNDTFTYGTKDGTNGFYYGSDSFVSYDESGIVLADTSNVPSGLTINITSRIWIAPSQNLMPSIYRSSLGAERFYNAQNNTYKDDSGNYYSFNNSFVTGNPHEIKVTEDDIKPTIKGVTNASGALFGTIAAIAFDKDDSDELDANNDYVHSYFYIRLNIFNGDYGFNLFNQASASDTAKISMTSGNCAACTFEIGVIKEQQNDKYIFHNPVQVDANGDIVSGNFAEKVNENNLIASQQNTQTNSVWIAVKKENSTFGVVMPNHNADYKPSVGDTFVITGIMMPKALVLAAEDKLTRTIIKYMKENNDEKFTFSISFSRVWLVNHPDTEKLLNENARLIIRYNNTDYTLYVSNFTLKADENILTEIDVELTDTLTVQQGQLQSAITQITNDILANGNSSADFLKEGLNYFLRKNAPDSTNYIIKFLKGIGLGTDYNITEKGIATLASILSKGSTDGLNGFRLTTDSNGNGHIQTDYLEVLKKAVFHELEVRKMSAVGGNIMLSPASSKVIKVEKLDASGNVTTGTAAAYKCYLKADDGTMQTQNTWKIGDQALCKTFNIKEGAYANVSNQYYWRVVTDCSSSVDADGNGYVTLSNDSNYYDTGSTEPKTEDTIVQCGYNDKYYLTVINPTDTSHASFPYSRTGVFVLESSVTSSSTVNYATRFRMLDLVTDFSLSDSLSTIVFDRDEIKISSSKFQWTTPNGDISAVVYYGTYDATKKYDYYSEVDYAGSRWLCTDKSGAAIGEIPSESSKYWTKVKTSAVYTGTLSDYSDTIVVDADGNCVGGLWFEVGNQTDASGNIIYESDGTTPKKLAQYRLHTAVFAMRDSTHLIYQEPTDSSGNYVTPSAGHYTFTVNYDGCTGNVANGTVYITGITHVKDGVTSSDDVWTDDDYELMRSLHQCRAIITIDCEGKKSVNVEMPVTIKHTDTSYINAHLNNAMGTVLWSTAANKYTLASVSSVLTTFHDDAQLPQLSGKDTKGNDICYALILNDSGTDVTSSFNVTLNIYNASTDSKNYRTEITIAPKSSSLADGKYFAYIHSVTKYAGVSYEHTNLITVIKQTDGMTYQIVPSTTIVKGLWNSDGSAIGSYSPTTVSASVTASDGISTVRTLTYSEWNALGLSLAINGTTITDSVTKVTVSGTGNYECVLSLSGTIIDREVIGYNQDGQTGKDGKSVTIKGEAAEHFTSNTLCDAATKDNSLYYLIDYTSPMWTNGAYTSTNKDATALSVGDGYLIGNSLWMWTGSKWNEIKDFKGSDGKSASVTYTIEYGASATYAQDPSTLNISWSSSLPAAVSGMYLYVRTTIKIYQDANLTSTLYQYNVSRIGDDGYSYEYIYTLSASDSVGTPSFSSSDDNSAITSSKIDTNNVTWYDVPQPITSTNPYLFVSQRNGYGSARHYDSSSSSHPWSAWSTPTLWARYGKDGKDMTALVCSPDVIKLTWTYDSGTETLSGNLKPTIKLVKGDGTSTVAANASVTFEPASDTSTAPTTTTDANGQFTITSSLIVRRFKGYFLTTQNSVDIPVKQTYCDISYTINSVNYTLRVQIMVDSSAFDASFEHDSQTFHSDYSSFKTSTNNTLTAQGTSIKQNADNIALKAAQTDLNTLSNEYSALNVKANNISLKVGSWQDKLNLIPNSVWHKCLTASSTGDTIIASWDIPVTKNKNYVLSAEGKNLLIQIYDAGDNTYTAKVVGTPISIIATPVHTAASSTLSVLIYARQGTTAQFNYAQLEETAISSGTENANTAWSPCKSDKDVSDNILTGTRDLSSGTSVSGADKTYTDDNGNEFAAYYSTMGDEIYITDAIELGVGLYTFSFLAKADVDAQTFIAGLYNSSNAVAFAFSYVASNGTSSVTTNEVTVAMSTSWMRYYITYNVTTAGTGYFEISPNDSMWFCAPKLTKCGAWDAWTNAIGYDNLLSSGLDIYKDFIAAYANHFKFYDNYGNDLGCFDDYGLTSKAVNCKNANGYVVFTVNEDNINGLIKRYYPDPDKNNVSKLLLMEEAYVYDASHNCIGIKRIYYNRDGSISYVIDESETKMTTGYVGWKSEEAYESTTRFPNGGTTDDGSALTKNCYKNTFVSNDANSKKYNGNVEVDQAPKSASDGLGSPTWYTGYLLGTNVTLLLSNTVPVVGVYMRNVYHYVDGKLTETLTNKTTKVYDGNFTPSL